VGREELPRLDTHTDIRNRILPFCRLGPGEVWEDKARGHRVAVVDAADPAGVARLTKGQRYELSVHDPPYNLRLPGSAGSPPLARLTPDAYLDFSRRWITNAVAALAENAHFYLWTGADQRAGFHPLPELILLLREFDELTSRSMVTLRNQRGYGTQKNWMSVRQELLYYTRGTPPFAVQRTEIPRILKGYYKNVGGRRTENTERSASPYIRPGNVWVDLQQVFYRLEENAPGAYAQKPLAAVARIIRSAATRGPVLDLFAHSGTTLLAAEREGMACHTADMDPVFAELAIRRLEHFRRTGKLGWQWRSPFPEVTG
jgi:site-specific DNA-methyltransferase (adenine-specific)